MSHEVTTMAAQSSTVGLSGLVLAAAPQAAALGAEAMRAGGNAYDAVVTAALAETVLLPPKCGLAGDLVALSVSSPGTVPEALVAIGGAPAGLADSFHRHGREVTGPRSVGVPGAPAGYAALAARGRLPLERLAEPAIRLASNGFVWAQVCEELAAMSIDLVKTWNPHPPRYFPDWRLPEAGAPMTLPGLGKLLEEFASRGAALFHGPVGDEVASYVQEQGGVLSAEDFEHAEAEWIEPAEGSLAGGRMWATPAPTHGPALLEALSAAIPNGDQGTVWELVQRSVAAKDTLHDNAGTSMVSAADGEGRAVTVVHSNSFPQFGSGLVVPGHDLILNNRPGRGFGDDPSHPNFPAAGRRPATTLHAWGVDNQDGGTMLGGTPGGENQVTWNIQLLSQYLSGTKDPGLLVVSPRWAFNAPNRLTMEDGFSSGDRDALRSRAETIENVGRWGLKSAQQILVVDQDGTSRGGVDPRTGGLALAV